MYTLKDKSGNSLKFRDGTMTRTGCYAAVYDNVPLGEGITFIHTEWIATEREFAKKHMQWVVSNKDSPFSHPNLSITFTVNSNGTEVFVLEVKDVNSVPTNRIMVVVNILRAINRFNYHEYIKGLTRKQAVAFVYLSLCWTTLATGELVYRTDYNDMMWVPKPLISERQVHSSQLLVSLIRCLKGQNPIKWVECQPLSRYSKGDSAIGRSGFNLVGTEDSIIEWCLPVEIRRELEQLQLSPSPRLRLYREEYYKFLARLVKVPSLTVTEFVRLNKLYHTQILKSVKEYASV